MRAGLRRAACLAGLALLAAGCAARVASPGEPGPGSACREGFYRGKYEPGTVAPEAAASGAAGRSPRAFRASVRRCVDGALLVELRGAVGGAQLVAAVRDGRARLVLAGERTVVDGEDSPALWERWTGLPISGALLAAALDGAADPATEREAAGWRVRRASQSSRPGACSACSSSSMPPGCGFPNWSASRYARRGPSATF